MRARMFSGIIIGDDFFSLHVIRKRINHHCLFRQSWQFAGEWLNKDRGRGIGRFAGGGGLNKDRSGGIGRFSREWLNKDRSRDIGGVP